MTTGEIPAAAPVTPEQERDVTPAGDMTSEQQEADTTSEHNDTTRSGQIDRFQALMQASAARRDEGLSVVAERRTLRERATDFAKWVAAPITSRLDARHVRKQEEASEKLHLAHDAMLDMIQSEAERHEALGTLSVQATKLAAEIEGLRNAHLNPLYDKQEELYTLRDEKDKELEGLELDAMSDLEVEEQARRAGKDAMKTLKTVGKANRQRAKNSAESSQESEDTLPSDENTDTEEKAPQTIDEIRAEIRARRDARIEALAGKPSASEKLAELAVNGINAPGNWRRKRQVVSARRQALREMAEETTRARLQRENDPKWKVIDEKNDEFRAIEARLDQLEKSEGGIAHWEAVIAERQRALDNIEAKINYNQSQALTEAEMAKRAKKEAKRAYKAGKRSEATGARAIEPLAFGENEGASAAEQNLDASEDTEAGSPNDDGRSDEYDGYLTEEERRKRGLL